MTKYNWGIIGTGWIAHDMADALNKTNGEIYAAANPNEAHLTEFVKEKSARSGQERFLRKIADGQRQGI